MTLHLIVELVAFALLMFVFVGAVAWCAAFALCGGWIANIIGLLGAFCMLMLMAVLQANNGEAMNALLDWASRWAR